jgi:hypothetical protein
MDIPLMVNFSWVNEAGTIERGKTYDLTTAMVLRFFDKYLLDKPTDLLEMQNDNPNFKIELVPGTD